MADYTGRQALLFLLIAASVAGQNTLHAADEATNAPATDLTPDTSDQEQQEQEKKAAQEEKSEKKAKKKLKKAAQAAAAQKAIEKATQSGSGEPAITVNITGAPEALAENLEAYLPSLRSVGCADDRVRMERFMDASTSKLVEGAEAMGYFSAQFEMSTERRNNCWQLNIAVKPGKPVRVETQDIKLTGPGEKLEDFQEIMREKPYDQGDIFVSSGYEDFKSSLKSTASRLGFFDAEFLKHQVLVNVDTFKADIDLEYKTGDRYQFGVVTIEQDVLDERYIKRYIRMEQGDTYNSDTLLKQRRLLEASGYYKDVQVSTQFSAAENAQVPVAITALRKERYTYTANLGYATDTNFRIETGMEAHWVNRRGHKLDAKLRLSQNDPAVGMVYKVPLWNPEHEFASFAVDWSRSDNNSVRGKKLQFEVNYNRQNDSGWKQTAFVSFLDESTKVVGNPELHSQLTLLGGRVSKTERDDALFPTEGWRVRAEVKGAYDGLLSDISLLQASLEGKYLYTFEHEGKAILRGEVGASWVDEFDSLPKSLRFFTGGQNSVRGYNFEAIGDKDIDGNVVGGKHKLVLSAEYEYPITEKISLAAFVDTGSTFDDFNNYSFKTGYGLGARYKSPLGPVRVDLAVPEDDPGDLHFYFSLGPDL